jgi:ParB-like chromosome segregation protein Spo0J
MRLQRIDVDISSVIVGPRFRKSLGDLPLLIESIKDVGLLQPIGIRPNKTLIYGGRRLEACKRLGMTTIAAVICETLDDDIACLKAERDENICREAMSISECVALSEAIEEHERAAAKERKSHGTTAPGKPKNASADSAQALDTGRTRDKVAAAVGLSHDTLSKARQVVEAAEDEDLPVEVRTVAKQAVEEMDRTGKVAGAHRAVAEAKDKASGKAEPPEQGTSWSRLQGMNDKARSFFESLVATRKENAKSDAVLNLYEDLASAIAAYKKSVTQRGS